MKTRNKVYRIIAVYLLLNLLAEYFMPVAAYALTGGPSQPEVESFEPIGTTEMVDMFTGDFNYNIPLMTVPGPNGGYPLNLAYHAGIGMEQEASWVGLGWNINAGVINRMMRGLPDDFNGATIEKQYQSRENNTLSVGLKGPSDDELFGFDIGGIYGQLFYNNYKGVGYNLSLSLSGQEANASNEGWSKSLTLSLNSQDGLGVSPDLCYSHERNRHMSKYHIGFSYTSREGLNAVNLHAERYEMMRYTYNRETSVTKSLNYGDRELASNSFNSSETGSFLDYKNHSSSGSGVQFSASGFVPNVSFPQRGMNLRFALAMGSIELNTVTVPFSFSQHHSSLLATVLAGSITTSAYALKPGLNYNASLSLQWAPKDPIPYDAYGYLNTQSAPSDAMLDFNRDKDVPPTKDVPALPVPVYTYDSYIIKGQGIGGMFRPYRNDVSVLHDPDMGYTIPTLMLTGEMAAEPSGNAHWGVGAGVGFTDVMSGDWYAMDHEVSPLYAATSKSTGVPLYEPVFFRCAGDMAENTPFTDLVGGVRPARFDMGFGFAGISLHSKLKNNLVDKDGSDLTVGSIRKRSTREKRNQSIEYFTNDQLATMNSFPYGSVRVYDANKFPRFNTSSGDSLLFMYDRESEFPGAAYGDQLGAMSVLNPDGNRYYYALPAYNKTQKEVVFSVDQACNINTHVATADYGTANTVNNNEGEDRLFSSVETPAYAHSYLLTSITGPDYVDITGNGPSDDDLGYWVRFNYSRIDNFNWRIPYASNDGNFNGGYISNVNDDKLSYVYGQKELYYLNSVETKTHLACFTLNSSQLREDARGVNDEDNSTPTSGTRQNFLKKIELFSKRDISENGSAARSIKTVNFGYTYSLCESVENNHISSGDDGKLTLDTLWFSHLGNEKGELSPYLFNYHVGNANENPTYDVADMDRWGNYQVEDAANKKFNAENPYTNQALADSVQRNNAAGAWSLKEINLPSGGRIVVDYEADDYAYVQDKRAMQMLRVNGVMGSTVDTSSTDKKSKIDKDHLRIMFKLDNPISTSDPQATQKRDEYAKGIEKLYFKIFEKLKPYDPGNAVAGQSKACDYIEGYATVKYSGGNPVMGWQTASGGYYTGAWIEVEPEKVTNNPLEVRETHPFRKAGWQYLRMQRPDLFGPRNDFGGAMFTLNPVVQAVKQILSATQALTGYYNYCWIRGFCKELVLVGSSDINYRPSYIRLNTNDYIKYGGGHRVRSIKLWDNWQSMVNDITPNNDGNESQTLYGQEFSYRMPDGTSSGVAEYEPLVGGEEIPHHLPVPYSSDKFLSNDKALFIEEPYGESMFPPANVGYRRVIVKNLNRTNVTKNRDGIKVHEFYTAKEFPVRVDKTEDVLQKKYWLPLPIPFLGSMSFNNRGYSQGYSIELNDMHGKPRSVATYSSNANMNDPFAQPVTKLEYIYNTENPFNATTANYLDNTVTVLDGDANYREGELGLITEMYMDKSERYSFSEVFSLDPNFDVAGASPVPSFSLVPSLEINEAQFRSAVTVKVIQRAGIIIEQRAFDQGSMAVTRNLMFDALTGVPLLTEVNNNFDNPVYSYKYAAHWAYDGMGHAAHNWGAVFNLTVSSAGEADYANAAEFFNVGDELVDFSTGAHYWVKEITTAISPTPDKVKLIQENGNNAGNATYTLTVVRSGRRNQQSVTNGTIVSLSNPVTSREFPLFTALNQWLDPEVSHEVEQITYQSCVDGSNDNVSIAINASNNSITFGAGGESCARVQFPDTFQPDDLDDLFGYSFTKMGNDVKIYNGTTGDLIWGTWIALNGCFEECIPDVLHADAQRFTDRWSYFYADMGDPLNSITSTNDYRYGKRGIWRQETSHLYQVDREQEDPTSIDVDGTYEHFVTYNWALTGAANNRWSLTARTTLYSPFGYSLEERDTINVYSSALYGYGNSLATAVSGNARYFESGFDGFEDYGSTYPQTAPAVLGHGHFLFTTSATTYPSLGSIGHTGKKSMEVDNGSPATFTTTVVSSYTGLSSTTTKFKPIAGKEYAFSCWIKNPGEPYTGTATVQVKVNSSTVATYTTSKNDVIIEGWHQVNVTIPAMSSGDQLDIVITSTDTGNPVYVDDVRVVPFGGTIKTYVYDPITLWLVAELDNRNFATLYNYDEEGVLVQVKKETTNGIITVRSARNNIRQ